MSAYVRATEQIRDDGRIFAEPGMVGEVLHSERFEDGSVALTVAFPGVSDATTCYLGQDVTAMLSVVPILSEAPMPAATAPRRSRLAFAATAAAAVLLLVVGMSWGPDVTSPVPARPAVGEVVDINRDWASGLQADQHVPEKPADTWRRAPCEGKQLEVNGACFLPLEQRPPCVDGYEHEGRCVVPVSKSGRPLSSIHR